PSDDASDDTRHEPEGIESRPRSEPLGEPAWVGLEALARVVFVRPENDLHGEQRGVDGGADALAALRVGEARRVAHEKDAVVHDRPPRVLVEQVRMAGPARRGLRVDAPAGGQEAVEVAEVGRKAARVAAAEADVEVVALPEQPAVAREVAAEVD